MYLKTRLVDTVRIDPEQLGMPIMASVGGALRDKLEGQIDKKLGALVAILDVVDIGDGRILVGDGGVYYEATFDALRVHRCRTARRADSCEPADR
jgi:DNA-directed RNA polymerase subunit E'